MAAEPEEVVDATVVPDEPQAPEQAAPTALALAPRQRKSEVIRALDADALVESFKEYQALIPRLLDDSDYQGTGRDRFKKKSAWRKIATAFDLDVVRISETVERDGSGQPIRAMAVYRAIAPSGRSMDGDGYCSIDEARFSSAKGRQKLENDLRATATTRAKNRAIADLVAAGEVSAEEVDAGGPPQAPAVPIADRALQMSLRRALDFLLDGDEGAVQGTWAAIVGTCDGTLPATVARSIATVAAHVKAFADQKEAAVIAAAEQMAETQTEAAA